MRRLNLLIAFFIAAFALQAQAPSGYYDNAEGKTGTALKAALHEIIKDHDEISYQQIWNAFQYTDLKSNGKIWDMYSDNPNGLPPYEFTYSDDQCGGYEGEGDCYNREHSWPKDWFNDDEKSTPGHDLHHIFPTDGYVNAQRSNYPYGEVSNATWTSQNGSKLGNGKSSLGYTGTVFEPIDEYKGDFARAIMYMSVRYYTEDDNWNTSGMTNKSEIKPWAIDMLLNWHRNDLPDAKEIARNNKIYTSYQHNRNPFIDNPDYAEMIWNPSWTSTCEIAVASNIEGAGDVSMVVTYNASPSIDFSTQGYYDATAIANATIDNNVSVAFNKGSNSNAPKYYTSGTAIRCYGGNYFTVSTTVGNITSIALTFGSSDGNNTITTNVGSYSDGSWSGSATSVKFTIGGTSGNRRLKGISVTYSYSSQPTQMITCAYGSTATLTATPSTHYDFANWTKNGSVISTNATYIVQVSENATYQANFTPKSYTISVVADSSCGMAYIGDAPEPVVTHTPSIDFSQQGYTNQQDMTNTTVTLDSNVGVQFYQGTNSNPPKYYNTGTAIRCYGGNYFTVSTTDGTITKIVLAFGSDDGSNTISVTPGQYNASTKTWTGSSSSVTFTINGTSGHRRVKKITVTYTTGGGSYVTEASIAYGSSTTITAVPNTGYSFVNWTTNNSHYSANATCDITVGGDASYTANFTANSIDANTSATLPALTLAENVAFTVNSGATMTVTGDITQASGSAIEIENGGQLICNNSVYVKMKKDITAWDGSNGWYAIASPVNNQLFSDVVNLVNTANDPLHNIYRYDEAEIEWEEYRDNHNIFTSFENGRGYLFRTEDNHGLIEFKGNNNVDAVNYPLSFASTNSNFKGFNLIGNPFTQNITWANLTKTNVDSEGYYLLNETSPNQGQWKAVTDADAVIPPMRAFLVQATGDNPSVSIARTSSKREYSDETDNIMFTVSNSQYSDEAYVMFKEGHGLNKISHRNADIPMLYVIDNDQHFAIADINENANVINLGFEAKTMGQYKLSLKTVGDFSRLNLIDRITGEDVDMLVEDEYSFVGTPSDINNRFIVRFSRGVTTNADDESFAYQNGDQIIIEGEGTLQIYDIMGRMVATQYLNGSGTWQATSVPTGVYILRLIGEDVKTQKIIVK